MQQLFADGIVDAHAQQSNNARDDAENEQLEDAVVFQGVSKYPMRIKCALLGWEGMKDAVAKALASQDKTPAGEAD